MAFTGSEKIPHHRGECKFKPICLDGEIKARPMLPLTMAFDHRVIDGAIAAEIVAEIKQSLENFNNRI